MYKSILFIFLSIVLHSAHAELSCASFFSSNMVIQRETKAPIWGKANPNEKISLSASWGAKGETTANAAGEWKVYLKTPKAGGPFTIDIKGSDANIQLKNVMSGDVWFCSGQSNMQTVVGRYYSADRVKEEAAKTKLRLFSTPLISSFEDKSDVEGQWTLSQEAEVKSFSATGFFFGKMLEEKLQIPIGLIVSAWGGRKIECFTPWEDQKNKAYLQTMREDALKATHSFSEAKAKEENDKAKKAWQKRKQAWIKGGKKGKAPRMPRMKVSPLMEGKHPSGIYSAMIHPFHGLAMKGVIWYQGEANANAIEGDGNAKDYQAMLTTMIKSWRREWNIGDFPFYTVQLPIYREAWTKPIEKEQAWPYIRESMLKSTFDVPNTAIAVALEYGEAKDIHPKKKQEVGELLARIALKKDYKQNIVWTGPLAEKCSFKGNKAIVTFENGGAPLSFEHNAPKGFAVIDDNDQVYEANATITSPNTLEISSTKAKKIKAVYYAWADNPKGANLKNEAKLAASPFRFLK